MVAKKNKKVKWGIHINKKKVAIVFWAFFGLWFIIFLFYSNIKMFQKRTDLDKNLDDLNVTMNSLSGEKDSLNFQLGETNSAEYLEKVAREDLGMQKPGEQVVVIKKDANNQSNEANSNGVLQLFSKLVDWIKGLFN